MEEKEERWNVFIPEKNVTVNVPKQWDYSTIMSEYEKKEKEQQELIKQKNKMIRQEKYSPLFKKNDNFAGFSKLLWEQEEEKKGRETSSITTAGKSFVNQLYDLTIGTTIKGKGIAEDVAENVVGIFKARELSPKQRKKFLKDVKDEGQKVIEETGNIVNMYRPFEVRKGESEIAQGLASTLTSFGLMGLTGALGGFEKGVTAAEVAKRGLPVAKLFGFYSGTEMYSKVREQGGSVEESLTKGVGAGVGETALEEIGLVTLLKGVRSRLFKKYPWAGFALSYGGTGAIQETAQTMKDIWIAGSRDTREADEKLNDVIESAIYGAIGEMFGGGVSSITHAKYRDKIRTQAVKTGYDEETANQIAWEVTENPQGVANAVLDEMKNGAKMLSPDDIRKGQEFIEEALAKGGKEADKFIELKNTLKEKMVQAGYDEKRADSEADYRATLDVSLWNILKEQGGADISFDDFMNKRVANIQNIDEDIYLKEMADRFNYPQMTIEIADQIEMFQNRGATDKQIIEALQTIGERGGSLFSMVGEKAILPKKARTSLDEAKSLEQDGLLNNEQIRQTTGWYKGIDGQWKLEISDKDAKINIENITKQGLKLGDILSHDILYGAYPKLKDIPVVYNPNISAIASVRKKYSEIVLGRKFKNDSDTEQRKTIMHEVQHLIQGKEGFAVGGSTGNFRSPKTTFNEKMDLWRRNLIAETLLDSLDLKSTAPVSTARRLMSEIKEKAKHSEFLQDRIKKFEELEEQFKEYDQKTSYAKYSKLGGELEANLTAERIDLTDEERRKTPIEYPDDAIIKFNDGVTVPYRVGDNSLFSRGSTIKGLYNPTERVIKLFKSQTPDTLMHELSHNFFANYFELTEQYGLSERNKAIYDMLGKQSSKEFGTAEWETITEEFMKYLRTSEAPNIAARNLFERAKDWIIETFYTLNKTETPSPEVKEFFDNLISEDSRSADLTDLQMSPRALKDVLKSIKTGNEFGLKGIRRSDLRALRKAFHAFVSRKGKTLAEEMYSDGMRIKADSELAKQLGYDSRKKISEQPVFSEKGQIDSMDSLDEYLVEKGLLEPNQSESYEQQSDRENQIENIIYQADSIYSPEEQKIADRRSAAEYNIYKASELADEILKDNELGIKNIDELNEYLDKAIDMAKSVDSILVNKNAIDFLVDGYQNAKKLSSKLEKELAKTKADLKEAQDTVKANDKLVGIVAKELSNVQDVRDSRQELIDYIRNLPLSAEHRLSLIDKVKQVQKGSDYTKVLEKVNDTFEKMWEQEVKTLVGNNIDLIIKSTKPKDRKHQKFNYDYNKMFEEFRKINSMNQKQASAELSKFMSELEEQSEFTEADKVKNMLLSYKANGKKSSLDLMRNLEEALFNIRQDAIEDREKYLIAKAEKKEQQINSMVEYINTTKKVGALSQTSLKFTNLYSNEAELFGKDWADAHEMETVELAQNIKVRQRIDEMVREGKQIYGTNGDYDFAKLINEKSQKKFTLYGLNGKAEGSVKEISLMDIMDIYLTIKNKHNAEIYDFLYEQHDDEGKTLTHNIQDLLDNLSDEDRKFADALQKKVQSWRDEENKIYVKIYGIDMPQHEEYWMRSSEKPETELMDIRRFSGVDMIPSFMKDRATFPFVSPENVWVKFQKRVNDSTYMTNTFEKFKEQYDLIHNHKVKNAITSKYDGRRFASLTDSLNDISLSGTHEVFDEMQNLVSQAVGNWVVSQIAVNEAVFVKQLGSLTNYAENMNIGDFMKYEAEFLMNPAKAIKFMRDFDKEFLDYRFSSGMQNEVLGKIMGDAERNLSKYGYTYQKYLDLITLPVRYGDVGAIYMGGYARVKQLLKEGKTLDEARKIFRFETQRSQQSGLRSSMAQFQKHKYGKLFTAFKNTQLQYMRKLQDSYIQWRRGEISTKQAAKIWGNYMFVQSIIYQVLTNVFSYLRDDDDDKEMDWFKDVGMQIITSPIAGVPYLGDMTQDLLRDKHYDLGIAGLGDVNKFLRQVKSVQKKYSEDELDAKTVLKGIATITQFVKPLPNNVINNVLND